LDDGDLGMAFAEGLQHRCAEDVDHGRDADLQAAAAQRLGIAHLGVQPLHGSQDLLALFIHHAPGIGELQAAPVAHQQRGVDLVFELAHHLADGGLGHVQGIGGPAEAGLANRLGEVAQGADVHGSGFRRCFRVAGKYAFSDWNGGILIIQCIPAGSYTWTKQDARSPSRMHFSP
jgi:hypothetical protein